MKRWLWILIVAIVLAGTAGCYSNNQNNCTPGATRQCTCPDGSNGAQHCREDGSGYVPCLCRPGDTSTDTAERDTGLLDTGGDTRTADTDAVDTAPPSDTAADGGPSDTADTTSTDTTVAPPQLAVDDRVAFASVDPGTRASKRLEVRNAGDGPLTIERIQLNNGGPFTIRKAIDQGTSGSSKDAGQSGDDSPVPSEDDPVSSVEGMSLGGGESVDLRVYFEPTDTRPREAELVIESDAPNNSNATSELSGNLESPCLSLSAGQDIDFGKTTNGQTTTVTVSNCRSRAGDLELGNVEVTDDAGGAFSVDSSSLPGNLADGTSYTLAGDERVNFVVEFAPTADQTYNGKLLLESNDPSRQQFRVDLRGEGTSDQCPTAVAEGSITGGNGSTSTNLNTRPLETVQLDASSSSDPEGQVARYEWSLIDRPNDSTARLTPNSTVEQPKLFLDLAGKYIVELVVYDSEGIRSCGQSARVEIRAVPNEDIHVQLVWSTPADGDPTDTSGADLDLHYLHPNGKWNEGPWDIFWHNKTGDWGAPNDKSDDPSLDIDDTDGAGPENVNHDNPEMGKTYSVGVYYYDDNGFGPSYATVRIYIDSQLKKEFQKKYLKSTFDFWKVALVEWPSKSIYKRDKKFQGFPNP